MTCQASEPLACLASELTVKLVQGMIESLHQLWHLRVSLRLTHHFGGNFLSSTMRSRETSM